MFRFTIRDLLWLMLVAAVVSQLWVQQASLEKERQLWNNERQTLLEQHDANLANERRLALLKAREMAGQLLAGPAIQKGKPVKLNTFQLPISR